MMFLEQAIYSYLTADAELVALLGHTASSIRITTSYPDRIQVYPAVTFWIERSFNYIASIDEIQATLINFACLVSPRDSTSYNGWTTGGQVYCGRLLQRLKDLFQPGNQQDADLSNSQVRTLSVLLDEIYPTVYVNEIDIYRADIMVNIKWHRL